MNDIKILSDLFTKKYGFAPTSVAALPGAGSNRAYYRLEGDDKSCIGVIGENSKDNRAFIKLATLFGREGINVPEVFEVSEDGMCYIQEDLGNVSLFSIIKSKDCCSESRQEEKREETESLIKEALTDLVKMQMVDKEKIEQAVEYSPFSKRQIFWDLNYFKYEYLKPIGVDFNEETLEDDFELLADDLNKVSQEMSGFMYRDFQSRNILYKNSRLYFIDFQGGRMGPGIYDAVSLLWQAKAGFSETFRKEMIKHYAETYENKRGFSAEAIRNITPLFVLFRTLQVLGAYGFRGLIEKKAHFIESIPPALKNLKEVITAGVADKYPELKRVCEKIMGDVRFCEKGNKEKLTVQVFSFSYKKGYPADFSGNGGGFMFDCRGMHNPGRYKEYKTLTGMDKPVIDFLIEKGEADLYSERAAEIVSPTVERYIKRGFTNLQIGFGCTGGQHRSVFCAESVSKILATRFPEAIIEVCHREQGIRYTR